MRRRRRHGFTLLEVLVATTIMAIAVAALLEALSGSLKNASRLTESDRAVILAKRTMDQLLVEPSLPEGRLLEGPGWRARIEPFETIPGAPRDAGVIQRVVLEVTSGTRKFQLEGYRRAVHLP